MVIRTVFVACALSSASLAQAAYPSEYPFENELVVPPSLIAATPSNTYDADDPGGYVYAYGYTRTELGELPTTQWMQGMISHMQVAYELPALYPVEGSNCTGKGRGIIGPDSFLSNLGGEEVCKPGQCCKMLWGQYSYLVSEIAEGAYDWENGNLLDGLCDGAFVEEVFCTIFDRFHTVACHEYYLSDTERSFVFPCFDYIFRFYMDCKLYKNTGFEWDPNVEPASYWALNSPAELNSHYANFRRSDRVCNPYSYYVPEASKGTVDDTDKASEVSDASTSQSSMSESTGALAFISAVFACVALFL